MGKIYKSGVLYSGGSSGIIIEGYYFEGSFYSDTAHTQELVKSKEELYRDMTLVEGSPTNKLYFYDGEEFISVASSGVDPATPTQAGIAKLYNTEGTNTDGSINQKFITDSIDDLDFEIETDSEGENCLILNKP